MVTWISALARTRSQIRGALARVFTRTPQQPEISPEELEETLLRADLPARLVAELVADLEKSYGGLRVSKKDMLKKMLLEALGTSAEFSWENAVRPLVVLIVGVNGSGKTTTCAKLARLTQKAGLKPLLGATDTFRAAGAEQLKWWAGHLDSDVVAGAPGADAAAVAYDALSAACARNSDVLFIDTAGRMHTKQPLMQELGKVRASVAKRLAGAPQETWMVLDATLGQNAILQARQFHAAVPLTGVVISKLDGSSKAGFVFALRKELDVPIRFVGLGEGPDDLAAFDPANFVEALMEDDEPAPENGDAGRA